MFLHVQAEVHGVGDSKVRLNPHGAELRHCCALEWVHILLPLNVRSVERVSGIGAGGIVLRKQVAAISRSALYHVGHRGNVVKHTESAADGHAAIGARSVGEPQARTKGPEVVLIELGDKTLARHKAVEVVLGVVHGSGQ